ncbi:MAG TPA: hypothetical protein VM433_07195 [Mycobacteriales bacterium]|nr:hypothetical protein [Mycobacteriales bacterium]
MTALPADPAVLATAPLPPPPAGPPVLPSGPDAAPADGAAAFLATLAQYEGCAVERLE